MSRQLITLGAVLGLAGAAHAQSAAPDGTPPDAIPTDAAPTDAAPTDAAPTDAAPTGYAPRPHIPPMMTEPAGDDDLGDQAISAQLGLASGGRITPGGLRVAGHYLYQLSGQDWFDGMASFTFGSSSAGCFRDRENRVVCDHGLADGAAVEAIGGVRRVFAAQGAFRPYARLGVGLGLARFADDDVSGVTINAHGGAGVRVKVAPSLAVVAEADLALGFGSFNRSLGSQLQTGIAVTAGVEFRLR